MDKAILVIDMPKCCYECFAFNDSGDYSECIVTKDYRGYRFRPREQKMHNCPLKPVPEEELIWYDDSSSDWERGYNSCLREIVGKEEDYE